MNLDDLTMDVEQHIEIKGSPDKVFAKMLDHFGKGFTRPDGVSMDMILEPNAGGRWYRDRGQGIEHLWGFVQVIKPPVLLELSGPMFMSYPAINHMECKIEEIPTGCRVTLRHRAIGMIDPEHRKGVGMGWGHLLSELKKDSEQ